MLRQQVATIPPVTNDDTNEGVKLGPDAEKLQQESMHDKKIASLIEFTPRTVKFQAVLNNSTLQSNSGYDIAEIEGPRNGFVWDVRRLCLDLTPVILNGASNISLAASVLVEALLVYEIRPDSTVSLNAAGLTFPNISASLLYANYGFAPAGSKAAAAALTETFGDHEITINPGNNLAVVIITNGVTAGDSYVFNGQAVETPQAAYPDFNLGL